MNKQCPKCKIEKDSKEFYKSKQRKDGLRYYCKECEAKFNSEREPRYKEQRRKYRRTEKYKSIKRKFYQKNRKKILQANSQWRQSPNGRLLSYQKAADIRNIPWEISKKQFLSFWQAPCSYCGAEINTIGLDRINNKEGYHIDNVIPCCSVCNRMKMSMDYEEFLEKILQICVQMNLQKDA